MYLYFRWIIVVDIEFSQIKNLDFKVFLQYINKFANVMLSFSNFIIQVKIILLYKKEKKRVRYLLNSTIILIHVTCDDWISSNRLKFLNVITHFIDEKKTLRIMLLTLKKIKNNHNDENMTIIIHKVTRTYDFRDKLSYFVMNNVNNNDTMMKIISKNLYDVDDVYYDFVKYRLRCINHIINLFVQAFLFDDHFDIDDEITTTNFIDAKLQTYRKFESLKKFHNVIIYIMYNSQRIQRFKALSKDVMSMRDHKIKWNFWFMMLERALDKIKNAL